MSRAWIPWAAALLGVSVVGFVGGRWSAPEPTVPVVVKVRATSTDAPWRAALDATRATADAGALRGQALEVLNTADGDVALGDGVRLLGWVGQPEDHDLLYSFARSREPSLRDPGLEALGRLGTDQAVETLIALLDDRDVPRSQVLYALGASGRARSAEVLAKHLQDPQDVWAASQALSRVATPYAVNALTAALLRSDAYRAGALARGLSALADDVPQASDALHLVLVGPRTPVRAAALLALAEDHDPAVYDILVADVRTRGPAAAQAVVALGQLGDPRAVSLLANEARDGSTDTRYGAIAALAQLDHPLADQALLRLVAEAPAPVAAQAVGSVPRVDDPAMVDALLDAGEGRPRAVTQAILQRLLGEAWGLGQVPPRVLDLARHQLTAASWDTWGIDPVGVLLQHGTDADVVLVEEALRTGPTNLRSAAVWSLSSAPPHRAERLLELLSADPDMNVRQGALSVMMQLGMYDLVEQRLLADLENGGMSYGSTEHLLVQLGTPEAMKAVMDRIEGGTRREWNNAISAVASAGRKEHVVQLLDLADRTEQPELRQAILQSLIYSDTVDVDAVVDRALATDDPNLHSTAAQALSRSGTERSRELLRELARSDNPMVASSALSSLGQLGGEDAEAALIEALDHPDVAWSAVNGLQNLGTPSARATLLEAARTAEDPTVRSAALQTLPHLGAEGANEVLRDALEDMDDEVRYSAVGALESVGTTQAAETLASALRSGDLDDDQAMPVAQALQRMGGEVAEANADLIDELVPSSDGLDTGMGVEPMDMPF